MLLAVRPEYDRSLASTMMAQSFAQSGLHPIFANIFDDTCINNLLKIDNHIVILKALTCGAAPRVASLWGMLFLVMLANAESMAAYKDSTHLVPRLGTNVKAVSASSTSTSF